MKKEFMVQRNPKSPISEVFRTLRTNIQFMNANNNLKTILVTSSAPGEGKSWVSANLAITFAEANKKVLLIDADMRMGKVARMFKVASTPGLSNYLSGIDELGMKLKEELDIDKYIKATENENLYLITAGNLPPNPAELLTSEKTIEMINKVKEEFDIIIFDAPPTLIVADAIILSRFIDNTVLVAQYKKTKKENIIKTKKAIENVGGKIAGVIINRTETDATKYKYSYYYGETALQTIRRERRKEEFEEG